ncbi:ankyrin repeat and protein kinase domain-containing protein 1-like [Haliotis asinina]|uniref:ankyrin repeat and protein kinase domain-containing protein 1-like n=1 Tax=Haliotis asinina TaxID=109174 RepID=UPI0035326950
MSHRLLGIKTLGQIIKINAIPRSSALNHQDPFLHQHRGATKQVAPPVTSYDQPWGAEDTLCPENSPPICDLHYASKTGDLSRVKLLLSQGQADVNCQEWIGRTPVMWAASGGYIEVVELLVSKRANLTLDDRFGMNILHSACLGGDVKVVKYVLSQNILDINGRVRCGRTAVMLAAENGHKDVVEMLIDKEADVSLVDETGDNVLHCACRGGHAEVVKYILSKKMVDINSLVHGKKTPTMVAIERQLDVVKYILSLNSVDINCKGRKKRTPVIVAAEQGHTEVVKLLVKHAANLLLRDENGDNILHRACYAGQLDVVKYILSLKSMDINSRGWRKRTPVIVAAEQGHTEVVKLLVKHAANLLLRDENGDDILHCACYPGRVDVVKYVLSLNTVDINSKGLKKRTPPMAATIYGKKEVVELLVKHGADLLLSGIEEAVCLVSMKFNMSLVVSSLLLQIAAAGSVTSSIAMTAEPPTYTGSSSIELRCSLGGNPGSIKDILAIMIGKLEGTKVPLAAVSDSEAAHVANSVKQRANASGRLNHTDISKSYLVLNMGNASCDDVKPYYCTMNVKSYIIIHALTGSMNYTLPDGALSDDKQNPCNDIPPNPGKGCRAGSSVSILSCILGLIVLQMLSTI